MSGKPKRKLTGEVFLDLTYVVMQDTGARCTQRSWTVYLQTETDRRRRQYHKSTDRCQQQRVLMWVARQSTYRCRRDPACPHPSACSGRGYSRRVCWSALAARSASHHLLHSATKQQQHRVTTYLWMEDWSNRFNTEIAKVTTWSEHYYSHQCYLEYIKASLVLSLW